MTKTKLKSLVRKWQLSSYEYEARVAATPASSTACVAARMCARFLT